MEKKKQQHRKPTEPQGPCPDLKGFSINALTVSPTQLAAPHRMALTLEYFLRRPHESSQGPPGAPQNERALNFVSTAPAKREPIGISK
jgi:hypothetical protein